MFDSVFRSSPVANSISRVSDHLVVDVNRSFTALFGFNADELVGKRSLPDIMKEDETAESVMKRLEQEESICNHEIRSCTKEGVVLCLLLSVQKFRRNREDHFLSTWIDITAKKKAEEQLKRSNEELERKIKERTIELTNALQWEKELHEHKGRFVTTASHEFRTPLSAILSSAYLVERYAESGQKEMHRKHVERIKSSVSNLTEKLNDMLMLEKLDRGKTEIEAVVFNIREFSEEIMAGLQTSLKRGQEICYQHNGQEEVCRDREMLRVIMVNLLSNAVKYSRENEKVMLETKVNDNRLSIVVSDKGIGIPPEEQKNIYSKFFRARNAMNIGGTGLGLTIVKKYVELLNGTISFVSTLAAGTVFMVDL